MLNTAEQQAEEKNRIIVRFTNIDKESFTHAYKGVTITVQAGESYIGREPECNHLATHLARKMLSQIAKSKTSKDNTQIKLWTSEQVEELKAKIITPMGNQAPPAPPTPEQKRTEDLKNIEKEFPPAPVAPVTKKDVIGELKKRGADVDVTKTLKELLNQLMQLEAQGK